MEYIINIWKESSSNGTACVFRSENRKEFEKRKAQIIREIKPFRDIARLVIFKDRVIFSYADSANAFSTWVHLDFFKRPLAVRYMKIKEITENAK